MAVSWKRVVIGVAVGGVMGAGFGAMVQAQEPRSGASALARCIAAAERAQSSAPTTFACDWRTVLRTAPGAALTGRYVKVGRNPQGVLTIIERGDAPANIGVMTTARPSARTCTVAVQAQREPSDALVARPKEAPGCVISIRSTKANIVSLTTTPACQHFCGVGVGFDGAYKLSR